MYGNIISDCFYLKNPRQTDLGLRIIRSASSQIEALGFSSVTLKKIASDIGSVEASVYRYFENKEHLLFYLLSDYWSIVELKLEIARLQGNTPIEKVFNSIDVLFGTDDLALKGLAADVDLKTLRLIARKYFYFALSLLQDSPTDLQVEMYKKFQTHLVNIREDLAKDLKVILPNFSSVSLLCDTILNESLYSTQELQLSGLDPEKDGYKKLGSYLKELIARIR